MTWSYVRIAQIIYKKARLTPTLQYFSTIISGVAREGEEGAAAYGRRPEESAKILPKKFFTFLYGEIFRLARAPLEIW